MRYTTEERVEIALRRGTALARKRERSARRRLSCLSGILFAMLLAVIWTLPEGRSASAPGSVYGAFMLSAQAGGYLLTALIAFLLGVAVTLLCVRRKRPAPPARKGDSNDDSEVTP